MDKIEKYKNIIQKELEYQASIPFENAPDLKRYLIVNESKTQFILMVLGWHEECYKHYCMFHVELIDDMIWVHQDNTDIGIAKRFSNESIPKKDIVLGFLAPYARELSDYATA